MEWFSINPKSVPLAYLNRQAFGNVITNVTASDSRGRPDLGEGSVVNAVFTRRSRRESERVKRALKPSNAGGAKDPDFRHACDEG